MTLRCLSVFAAVAQPAVAINFKVFNGEEVDSGLSLSVQARQYALLHSHEELVDGLDVDAADAPKPSHLLAGRSARHLGEAASLSEDGYSAVAGLQSKEAMEAFAERLLSEDGLQVKDMNMLRRVMPFYNGECAKQSFKALRTELHEATAHHACHAAWVAKDPSAKKSISLMAKKPSAVVKPQHGDVAPLNQDGYMAVAALKSDEEMKKFIRRVSKSEGFNVMNEGGLSGFARYYSGVCATQSFSALVKELKSVQPVVKTTAISYDLPSDDAVDEDKLRQRIAKATGLKVDQIEIGSDDGSAPDAAHLKKALAAKMGVEEERVNVMHLDNKSQQAAAKPTTPSGAKSHQSLVKSRPAAPKKATKTVVVTVTSTGGVSVEDALKKLSSDSSMGMKIHREPVTMVASIPKPESCGGGWVAPSAN